MGFTQDLLTSRRNIADGSSRIGELDRLWYSSDDNTIRIGDGVTPGGVIVTGGGGGGTYILPTASTTVKGGVKIDGTTIKILNEVISGFDGNYNSLTNKPVIFSGSYNDLTDKPTIPAAQVNSDWNATSGVAAILNKPVLFSGSYNDLTNKPTIPAAQVNSDWNASSGVAAILNKPVIFSGSYNDLTDKPTIPAAQVNSDWNAVSGVAAILNKPVLFSGSYNDLTDKPTIPAAQVNSDWNATSGVAAILNKPTIPAAQVNSDWNATSGVAEILNKPDIGAISEVFAATSEPMGHEDFTKSAISFSNSSRTFTITPVNGSYNIWVKGTKHVISTSKSVTIPNQNGLYYIYFDSTGALLYKTTFYDWPNDCMTAYVYWNALTQKAPFVADERHGITLDWQTHEYLHRTRGSAIANGFAASNYIVGGDGSLDSHLQLDLSSGTFFDEDLQVDVVSTNTPLPNTWQQDLTGPSQIPMFYINSGGGWVMDTPTLFPVKMGTLPKYNLYSGGVWSTPDIDNNKFGITFILATNNINYPVIGIIGQTAHDNQGDSEAINFTDLSLPGFPIVEFRVLYKLVYQCKTSYTNAVHARLVSIFDLRSFSSTTSAIATYTDHGSLGGLLDDDHPQYLLRTDLPTTNTGTATKLQTSRNINGVAFDGSADITVTAAAGTLTGTTLNSSVVSSSLTSVGTLTGLTVSGTINANNGTLSTNQTTANIFTSTPTINIGTTSGSTAVNIGYIGNTTINNILKVNYTGSAAVSSVWITGYNNKGPAGYHDFLQATNSYGSATNPNKHFRIDSTGTLELLNSAYNSTLLSIADNGIVTLPNTSSVTNNSATSNALNIGTHGQIFDDGNFHIHSTSGSVWINSLNGNDIRLGTQSNSGTSSVIVNTASVAHSFFCKVQTGFNVNEPSLQMDNLNVRLRWTGSGSNLISELSAISGSFVAYVTIVDNVAGQSLRGDTNANGITFTAGTWTSINATFTISSGGDMLTYHVIDNTNSRIYRVTAIHCAGTKGGYISIERMC